MIWKNNKNKKDESDVIIITNKVDDLYSNSSWNYGCAHFIHSALVDCYIVLYIAYQSHIN